MSGALSGFAQGFGQSGGVSAVGQGLNGMINGQPATTMPDPTQDPAFQAQLNQTIGANQQQINSDTTAAMAQAGIPVGNATPAANANQASTLGPMQAGGLVPQRKPLHPIAHPGHPFWPLMHRIAGVEDTQQAPKPNGSETINEQGQEPQQQGLATGGLVQAHPPQPANFGGARPPPGTHAFANGGPVRGGATAPVIHGKRQAMPVGPNDGIVPASTEGQALTMEQGGPVPQGYDDGGFVGSGMMNVPGQGAPAMSGRWAGVSAGLPAGMAMGHNLRQQYEEGQARSAAESGIDSQAKADRDAYRQVHGLPTEDQQMGSTGLSATVHDWVNHALNMFHTKSLDDQGNQNSNLPGYTPHPAVQAPVGGAAPAAIPAGAAPAAGAPPQGAVAPSQGAAPPPAAAGAPAGTPPPAAAPVAGAAPGAAPAAAGAGPSPAVAAAAATPGGRAGVAALQQTGDPTQAKASAISVQSGISQAKEQGAAATPAASGKPVSLTASDWEDMEQAKFKAARAAAAAGMDPSKVYQSLTAMQTSHFQGQYIRNLGAAQQALATGDYSGMKDAMKAASYYLPNGQDLKFTEQGGVPMVTNPFYGMPGHEKDPQQVPINATSLNNMATAALDPQAFGKGLLEQYKAGVTAQTEILKAQGYNTGMTGRWMQGSAQLIRSQVGQAMFPANYAQTMSKAELERAQAAEWRYRSSGQGGGTKITAGNALAYSKQGQAEFDNQSQGQLRPAPTVVPDPGGMKNKDGTPVMVPNPHVGQPQRDPTTISPVYRGLTPAERQQGGALAQQISAANIGDGMTPGTAAEIAARVQVAARSPNANHKGDDGKVYPNLVMSHGEDGKPPHVSVWDGHRYMQAWTSPNILAEGPAPGGIDTGGGNAGGGGGESPEQPVEEPPT